MIPLGPVVSSQGNTFTQNQVIGLLIGPTLKMRWLFDWLGPQLQYKGDLTNLINYDQPPAIDHDTTRAVKRQLTFRMRATSSVDTLRDLIRVRYQIQAPDGGWLEWTIGLFIFTPPTKEIHEGYTWWNIIAPDLSQLLSDASFSASTSIPAGANYVTWIASMILTYGGWTPLTTNVVNQGRVLPAPLSWDAGKASRLKAANDLLLAMNYVTGWMRYNVFYSRPEYDYTTVVPVITFDTIAGQAWLVGPLQESADYSNAFNQFLVVGQDPRNQAISQVTAYYENRRTDSPISLVNWRPRMAPVINDSTITDAPTAYARARTEAQKSARIFSILQVGVAPFPFFEDLDVVTLAYNSTDEGQVRRNFVVVGGTHTCHATTPTVGKLQRVVAA